MVRKSKRSSSKSRNSRLAIEMLEPRQLLSANPLISEFMASNTKTLLDYYGKYPDWLEIHNPYTAAVDLSGWQLKSDDTTWSFPSGTNLDSNSYMVVFCDEKDTVAPNGELHTNFKLGASGDYLALMKPDNTVVSAYSPEYPQQIADVSYGWSYPYVTNSTFSSADGFVYADDMFTSVGSGSAASGAYSSTGGNIGGCLSLTTTMSSSKTINGGFAKNIIISASDTYTFSVDTKIDMSCTNTTYNLTPSDTGTAYLIVKDSSGTVLLTRSLTQAGNNTKSCNSGWNTLSGDLTLSAGTYTINLCLLDSKRVSGTGPKYINANFDNFFVVSTSATLTLVYLTTSTPGAVNSAGKTDLGPYVTDVTNVVEQPTVGDTLTITATVNPSLRAISTVQLAYRVMFESETPENTLTMYDDGLNGGDTTAGDHIYTAQIPTTSMTAGEMLRWRVIATDTSTIKTYTPSDPSYNPTDPNLPHYEQYYGTVAVDSVETLLPMAQFFVQNYSFGSQTTVDTDAGARGAIFYLGELYDNVLIRIKGMASRYMFKRSHHIDFNSDHKFLWEEGQPRVGTAMFNAEYQDPSYIRQYLSMWMHRDSGTGAMPDFPARLQMNGEFWQLAFFNLPASESLLNVMGYDPNGAMYKFVWQVEPVDPQNQAPVHPEKRTREWEGDADYTALATAITRSITQNPVDAQRTAAVYDMLDLPQVINYIAVARIVMECDDVWANMTIYRDSDGDGLWRIIPYDLNLSFGQMFAAESPANSGIHATDDYLKAHPLYGGREYQVPYTQVNSAYLFEYNQIYDAIMMNPDTREMLLRRMRSLMDEYLQAPGTPYANRTLENMIDEFVARAGADARMDKDKWGWPPQGGVYGMGTPSFYQAIEDIKTQYLDPRRTHMYVDHSLNTSYPDYAGIPAAQQSGLSINFGSYDSCPVSGNQEEEYITLVNPNSVAVDISGWKLSGGIEFTFASGTVIPAGGTLYVSPNSAAFRARTTGPTGGQGLYVVAGYNGRLSQWGEAIELLDGQHNVINTLTTPSDPSLAQQNLRITEIMYHPADPLADPSPESGYFNEDFEFVELKNIGAQPLDLTGVRFTDGPKFDFTGVPDLVSGARVLVVANQDAFQARYGHDWDGIIAGEFGVVNDTILDPTHLSNDGEKITLVDADGETILSFNYKDSWYKQTDGVGNSLVIRNAGDTDLSLWDQREGWFASHATTGAGSPGTDESPDYAVDAIVVNELLAHRVNDVLGDWVEFRNTTGSSINIGGWYISNDDEDLKKFQIPAGTVIPALGYKAFNWHDHFGDDDNDGCITPFTLGEMGGTIYLTSATGEVLTTYQVSEKFGSSDTGVTLGRYTKSTGGKDLVAMATPTYQTANSLPKVGPVVINEIYYHPASGQNAFIELKNITGNEVQLYDPALPDNTWHLTEGVDFIFPVGAAIPANGYALIVECDPAYFRTKYGIPSSVPIYGPYLGKLNKAGDTIEIKYPDDPQPDGEVPYDRMDQVTYGDSGLWPNLADGGGASLDRFSATSYGNDVANWTAGYPTPGAGYAVIIENPITIVTPASTSQATVTGTTTTLSVLGNFEQGESNIAYCWAVTSMPAGATVPTFNFNNNNRAKNSTVTFYSEGTYTFTVTLGDLFINRYAITGNVVEVTVAQTLTSMSIIPAAVNLYPGSTQQFSVAAFDQFSHIMGTPLSDVTWSVYSGIGTISSSGLYTAPTDGSGSATIRAITSTGQIFFADATITSDAVWYPANATSDTILADASGNGMDATLTGAAGFGAGMSGNALNLTGGYASLPTGVLSTLNDFTIAAWVKIDTLSTWSRIFDFGTGTYVNMFLTPRSGSGNLRFAITTSGGGGEQQINSTSSLATGSWQHVAVTLSGNTGTLYVNGAVVGTNTAMTLRPSSLGTTAQNYLGKSQYPDPAFLGSIDDFRIIGQALPAAEIRKFVYPSIATAAAASSITSTSANLSVLGGDVTNGESTLLYTWSVTGTPPSPVTFSANGTNAAKNTIANFTQLGTYNFLVTATNPAGYSTTSTVSVDVSPSALTVVPGNLPSTGAVNMTLTLDGDGNLHIYQTGSTTDIVAPMPFDMVSNVSIVGRDNYEDALTVDLAEGNPIPMGGATFNGGSGSGNSLLINGTSATDTVTMNASQIVVGGSAPIGYLNAAYFAFFLGGGADSLMLDHATLMLSQDNAISAGTSVTIDGGVLDLNGKTDTISAITMTSGSIVNGTLQATTYNVESGTVTATLVGSGNLNKTTTGHVTAGTVNTSSINVIAGQFTAASIHSGTLTIGAGSKVTIAPISSSPLSNTPVKPIATEVTQLTAAKSAVSETATASATDLAEINAPLSASSALLSVTNTARIETPIAQQDIASSNGLPTSAAVAKLIAEEAALSKPRVEIRLDSKVLHNIIENRLNQSISARRINNQSKPEIGSLFAEVPQHLSKLGKQPTANSLNGRQTYFEITQRNVRRAALDSTTDANITQNVRAGKFTRQLQKAIDAILADEEF